MALTTDVGHYTLVPHAPTAADQLKVPSQRPPDQLSLNSDAHQDVRR